MSSFSGYSRDDLLPNTPRAIVINGRKLICHNEREALAMARGVAPDGSLIVAQDVLRTEDGDVYRSWYPPGQGPDSSVR
jgi:hypothetical protein